MRIPKINWELTGKDTNDIIAGYGAYLLRVERMRKGVWWYAAYHKISMKGKSKEVFSGQARCKKEAKNKVSKALLESFV